MVVCMVVHVHDIEIVKEKMGKLLDIQVLFTAHVELVHAVEAYALHKITLEKVFLRAIKIKNRIRKVTAI